MKYKRLCEMSFQEAVIDEAGKKRTPATEDDLEEFVEIVREHPGILICDALLLINNKELDRLVKNGVLVRRMDDMMPAYYIKDD